MILFIGYGPFDNQPPEQSLQSFNADFYGGKLPGVMDDPYRTSNGSILWLDHF